MALGFIESKEDSNLYFKVEGEIPVMLLLYVDDLFLTGKEELIKYSRRRLAVEFEMKDLGMMHYFLGMEVWQSVDGIFLGQGKYAVEILKRFGLMDCKAMTTPMASNLELLSYASLEAVDPIMYRQMTGSLMYLMNMRPDICFAVNTFIQFLTNPRHVHLIATKHIMRYLKRTVDYGLKYEANQKINLEGYVDSNWAVPSIGRPLQGVASVWDQV